MRNLTWISVMSVGLAFTSAPVWALSNSAVKGYNKAIEMVNAGNFKDAKPVLDDVLFSESGFAEAYYARAVCKHSLGDAQGAISDLNQTITLKSEMVDAYGLRGVVWYEQEQWDPALQDFNYVLERRPKDAQALLGRGIVLLRQEHVQTARRDLRAFLKLRPDDPIAPKLRELLGSLSGESETEAPAAQTASGQVKGSKPMSSRAQALTQELLMRPPSMGEAYEKKVLRSERGGQVVGDIQSEKIGSGEPQ